jgi:hypothetical protein
MQLRADKPIHQSGMKEMLEIWLPQWFLADIAKVGVREPKINK